MVKMELSKEGLYLGYFKGVLNYAFKSVARICQYLIASVIIVAFLPLFCAMIVTYYLMGNCFKFVARIPFSTSFCKMVKYYYDTWLYPDNRSCDSQLTDPTTADETSECDSEGSDETDNESIHRVEVQMYKSQAGIGESFVEELVEIIRRQDDTPFDFISKKSVDEITSDSPLLVICIHASRLGADASKAIKGIPDPKSSALLIFHHKDQYALPTTESAQLLWESEFKNLYGIYDVACLTEKGVYDCVMNDKAVVHILDFIHSTHKMTSGGA